MLSVDSRVAIACFTLFMASSCTDRDRTATTPGAWTVDRAPLTDIHDVDPGGESIIESARGATRLPSGVVVVADQYASRLRFFDASGEPIRSVGRDGTGPGEFASVRWVKQCGVDSLFVWDYTRRTMMVFDTAGTFARQFRPEGNPQEFTCSRYGVFGVIGLPTAFLPPSADGTFLEAPIWIANENGDTTHWIGTTKFGQNRPLGALTRIAISQDRFYVGTAESAWVDIYGTTGLRSGLASIASPRRTPSESNYSRAIEARLAVAAIRAVRDMQRPVLEALPMPDWAPPYSDLLVDPDGILWAVTSIVGDSETTLRAVGRDGNIMADVSLPGDVTIHEVGRDYILGVSEDSVGLPHVLVFRLRRQ